MQRFVTRGWPALALFAAVALVAGCGQQDKGETKDDGKSKRVADADGEKNRGGNPKSDGNKKADGPKKPVDDHSGWWCPEHGLPEEVCDLCSKKYREAEKAKGNWCEHDRVKTSCFKCNPGLREKYAAEYKAKFGEDPPPIEDDEKKDGK